MSRKSRSCNTFIRPVAGYSPIVCVATFCLRVSSRQSSNMASSKSIPPPTPPEPIKKRNLYSYFIESVFCIGNLCGNGPFAFPFLITFPISYLIRLVTQTSTPLAISSLFLTIVYYIFVGLFRLFIYNPHLDPLLAIPGPKVVNRHICS